MIPVGTKVQVVTKGGGWCGYVGTVVEHRSGKLHVVSIDNPPAWAGGTQILRYRASSLKEV